MTNLLMPTPGVQFARPRGQSALFNSLAAYWAMDEASGARADAVNSLSLTDNNTVTSDTGVVYGTAARFTKANSEYLSRSSAALLQGGNIDFWFGLWCKMNTLPGGTAGYAILSKEDFNPTWEFRLDYNDSVDRFRFIVFPSGASEVRGNTLGAASAGVWYFVMAWHVASTAKVWMSINNGTADSGNVLSTPVANSAEFKIGARSLTPVEYFDGWIGPVMYGKNYVPTTDDIAFMYNGGVGRTFAALQAY